MINGKTSVLLPWCSDVSASFLKSYKIVSQVLTLLSELEHADNIISSTRFNQRPFVRGPQMVPKQQVHRAVYFLTASSLNSTRDHACQANLA